MYGFGIKQVFDGRRHVVIHWVISTRRHKGIGFILRIDMDGRVQVFERDESVWCKNSAEA